MSNLLRRSQLAKELQISWPTVKYYTEIGLFEFSSKTPHGQYLYDIEKIKPIYEKIKDLKRKRLSIKEIKQKLLIDRL